jgi:hypothetical protein
LMLQWAGMRSPEPCLKTRKTSFAWWRLLLKDNGWNLGVGFVRLVETVCSCARFLSVESWWLAGAFVCGLLSLPSSFWVGPRCFAQMEEGGLVGWRFWTLLGGCSLCFVWSCVVKLCDFVMKVMKFGLCPLMEKSWAPNPYGWSLRWGGSGQFFNFNLF